MDEKKMTDKELVKALEYCAYKENGCSTDCPLIDIENCTVFISKNALDIIHRLQDEKEELKQTKFGNWKVKFFKAQEEIERLTEELDLANETIDRNNKRYERVSIERQKALDRVDYLEDALLDKIRRNEELITAIKQAEQQAVKDTAKEIFTDLLKEFSIRKSCGNADVVVREMASRKGVEVE